MCHVCDWVSKGTDSPQRPPALLEPELLQTEKTSKGPYHILSYSSYFLLLDSYIENDDIGGKEKIGNPEFLFFPVFPNSLVSKR